MVVLTVDATMGFQATARIYNVGNPMGEFGQFVPGIAIARLERQAFVAGLAGVDGNRANFGIANPNQEDVEVTIYVLDSHGDLLHTEEMTVDGLSVVQVNDLFAGLGITPQRGVQLDMHTAGGIADLRLRVGGAQRHRRRDLHLRHEPEQLTAAAAGRGQSPELSPVPFGWRARIAWW